MKLSAISKVVMSSLLLTVAVSANAGHRPGHNNYKDQPVFKDACPQPAGLKDGFYVGAEAGYDSFRVRQGISAAGTISMVNSVTGWVGGIFAGYGQYFDNFYYLGGEVLANYNGSNPNIFTLGDNDGDTFSQKVKIKNTWGISLLPGIKLNDYVLGYLRLGYDWTKFESTLSGVDATAPATFSVSNNKTLGGWDAGLGMEALAGDNWSLRTEYNHIWYNSNTANSAGISNSYNISDNQFMLGLVYHVS